MRTPESFDYEHEAAMSGSSCGWLWHFAFGGFVVGGLASFVWQLSSGSIAPFWVIAFALLGLIPAGATFVVKFLTCGDSR
jgi:hypothetical protein